MSNYIVSDTSLGSVADAIRTKGGTSAPLTYPQGFIDAIDAISGGGDEPIPEDGKTRIFIHIAEDTPDNRLTFYLRFTAFTANNTTVDWGDGTVETLGSTTATNYPHKYAGGGDYVIAMTVNRGTISFIGASDACIYGSRISSNYHNCSRIRKIIFGDSATNIGAYVCYYCYAITSVVIQSGATNIGTAAFGSCYGLTSITIPDSVMNIESSAFLSCNGVSEYHFKRTTPPKLANTNAFNGIASDCIIYVPQGSLSAYQQATNWSQYSSHMQEEPT